MYSNIAATRHAPGSAVVSVLLLVLLAGFSLRSHGEPSRQAPSYLKDYEDLYRKDPHAAALAWFKEAKFGLFVHYTMGNVLKGGKSEFKKLAATMKKRAKRETGISSQQLVQAELLERFKAENFDADAICDLAVSAGMRYVNFTTKHMGGLYMFRTETTDFNSVKTHIGRDFVAELARACKKRDLGLFLYVPPSTAMTDGEYFETNHRILRELLTQYGPIAGIWFDGLSGYNGHPENYARLSETYAMVRSLQPQCLISFKDGAIGEEDFRTPEHFLFPTPVKWDNEKRQGRWEFKLAAWERKSRATYEKWFKNKPAEINTVMQECENRDGVGKPGGWVNDENARHLTADEVMFLLKVARQLDANLLMNIGPRGDGTVHPDDRKTLLEVGRRIKESGWPGER